MDYQYNIRTDQMHDHGERKKQLKYKHSTCNCMQCGGDLHWQPSLFPATCMDDAGTQL